MNRFSWLRYRDYSATFLLVIQLSSWLRTPNASQLSSDLATETKSLLSRFFYSSIMMICRFIINLQKILNIKRKKKEEEIRNLRRKVISFEPFKNARSSNEWRLHESVTLERTRNIKVTRIDKTKIITSCVWPSFSVYRYHDKLTLSRPSVS